MTTPKKSHGAWLAVTVALAGGTLPPAARADILLPAGAGVLNVKTDFGAKGDGVTDDTRSIENALLRAINAPQGVRRPVYFPTGTYLVSDRLAPRRPDGSWGCWLTLVGQSRIGTVIRLKDSASGYGDPGSPKAVVYTASSTPLGSSGFALERGDGNAAFGNVVRNLTIDTGRGNAGAIGLDFLGNNDAAVQDVTIRSGDGTGKAGLGLTRNDDGPLLIKGLSVIGFDYGLWGTTTAPYHCATLEHIRLQRQRVAGIYNQSLTLAIRDLVSDNLVPAIVQHSVNPEVSGLVALTDARLSGGTGAHAAAIVADGGSGRLYARRVHTQGYRRAISWNRVAVGGAQVAEYVSDPVSSLFPSPPHGLDLPVRETPTVPDGDPQTWANVAAFGAEPQTDFPLADAGGAIQAAIDSGARTVLIPPGLYGVRRTLHLRGRVSHLICLGTLAIIGGFDDPAHPAPLFEIETGEAPTLVIEGLMVEPWGQGRDDGMSAFFLDRSSRVKVFKHFLVSGFGGAHDRAAFQNTPGVGPLFLEDVSFHAPCRFALDTPQSVWARQFNPEHGPEGSVALDNNGGDVWLLGMKAEFDMTALRSRGGRVELLGGSFLVNSPEPTDYANPVPGFVNEGAQMSLDFTTQCGAHGDWREYLRETRGGTTRSLRKAGAPARGWGGQVGLCVSR